MSRQLLQRGALHGSPRMRPSTWFIWHAHRIPRGGRVVDLACGDGRHSIAAAELGCQVMGIDRDPVALALANRQAAATGLTAQWLELDLEGEWPALGVFDAVLVFNYLDRANMPRILQLVAPGGLLFMETFLEAQREAGWGPTSSAHLLRPGELARLVAPLTVLYGREALETVDSEHWRAVASVVAMKR